jgi:hypothetical protein
MTSFELPYWKTFDNIPQEIRDLYVVFSLRNEISLRDALKLDMIQSRVHLYTMYSNSEPLDRLKKQIEIFGYLGDRFPCLGKLETDGKIYLVEGRLRLEALRSFCEKSNIDLNSMSVTFYLAENFQDEDWMTLLLFEAECCSALFENQFSSKRPIALPLLHRMFWSNPKFAEFLFQLPGNVKGFSSLIKSYFPNIQDRTELFFLRSRFFTSDVFQKLCEFLESHFSRVAQSSSSNPKKLTPYAFDSAFGTVFDCLSTIHVSLHFFISQPTIKPVIQRNERQKKILLEGGAWKGILDQFNHHAMQFFSQPNFLDHRSIDDVADALKNLLNQLIRNQLNHDLELLEAEDDLSLQPQPQQLSSSSSQSAPPSVMPSFLDLPLLKKYDIRPDIIQNHAFFLPIWQEMNDSQNNDHSSPLACLSPRNAGSVLLLPDLPSDQVASSALRTTISTTAPALNSSSEVNRSQQRMLKCRDLATHISKIINGSFGQVRKRQKVLGILKPFIAQRPALFANLLPAIMNLMLQLAVPNDDVIDISDFETLLNNLLVHIQSAQQLTVIQEPIVHSASSSQPSIQSTETDATVPHALQNDEEPVDADDQGGESQEIEPSPLADIWDDCDWETFLKKFHIRFGYTDDEILHRLPNPNDREFFALLEGLRLQENNNAPVEPYFSHLQRKSNLINNNKRQRLD